MFNGPVPDRVSVERGSPYYDDRGVRIECKLDGELQTCVVEACVSEGWVKRMVVDEDHRIVQRLGEIVFEIVNGSVELTWQKAKKK